MNPSTMQSTQTTTRRPSRAVDDDKDDTLMLQLEPDTPLLDAHLAETLRHWIDEALRRYPNGLVVMAGTEDLPKMGRISLLSDMRNEAVARGFSGERVRYAIEPLSAGAPRAALILKVISARQAELEVQSINGLLAEANAQGEASCTSAS